MTLSHSAHRATARYVAMLLSAVVLTVTAASCSRIDDDRIPPVNVNLIFTTIGQWQHYGIGGALESRRFIKSSSNPVPADFPYTISSYTGYGGLLLVGDLYGNPLVYDLSCPYEAKPDIRVVVDNEAHNAYCPKCNSVYDVFGGDGRPIAGPSADRGYGLTRYRIFEGGAMNYRVITR